MIIELRHSLHSTLQRSHRDGKKKKEETHEYILCVRCTFLLFELLSPVPGDGRTECPLTNWGNNIAVKWSNQNGKYE